MFLIISIILLLHIYPLCFTEKAAHMLLSIAMKLLLHLAFLFYISVEEFVIFPVKQMGYKMLHSKFKLIYSREEMYSGQGRNPI